MRTSRMALTPELSRNCARANPRSGPLLTLLALAVIAFRLLPHFPRDFPPGRHRQLHFGPPRFRKSNGHCLVC
jgi:hypothetical protein